MSRARENFKPGFNLKGAQRELGHIEVSIEGLRHKVSQTMVSTDVPRKLKTEDSLSKSKQKRKRVSKPYQSCKQKLAKPRNKYSCGSHLQKQNNNTYNNTDRRGSKHHTEIYEEPGLQSLISLRETLCRLPSPRQEIKQIAKYYSSILQIISTMGQQHLSQLLMKLHQMYVQPIKEVFELVAPYECLLMKRRELSQQIEEQIVRNKQISFSMSQSQESQQINRLRTIIQLQSKEIQQLKNQKLEQVSKQKLEAAFVPGDAQRKQPREEREIKQLKDFKIDLSILKGNKPLGYHEEFMARLPQMSQSWREQALREQRC